MSSSGTSNGCGQTRQVVRASSASAAELLFLPIYFGHPTISAISVNWAFAESTHEHYHSPCPSRFPDGFRVKVLLEPVTSIRH